jgi:hypothetical protein
MKRSEKNPSGMVSMAAFMLTAAACSQVLGIDEARVDPGLTTGGGFDAGTGGSTGVDASNPGETGGTSGAGGSGGAGAATVDSGGGWPDIGNDSNDSAICKQYCSDIMEYCKDNQKQYVDAQQCLKVCALFPEGQISDADGNTASCRLKYASKARYAAGSERDAYCQKSGPGSDGTCGQICDGFCTIMMPTCTPKFAPYNYPSMGDCQTSCRMLKDAPPYTVADGTLPDRNDSQCRLFHANSSVMDPDEHCEHAMGVTMCEGIDGGHAH